MSDPVTAPKRRRRLRDQVAIVWLSAAFILTFVHRWVPSASWLMVHLVLLGALTHSALVWSEHFAHTLLRTIPDERGRRAQSLRIGLLALGTVGVLVGVPGQWWWLVVAGALVVSVAVIWHAVHLLGCLRKALPSRFRIVTRYYLAAAGCLPVGAGFGAALAFGLSEQMHGRLLVAHMTMNLLGWVGLTVLGTLVTFWPTLLRARMDDRAERLARQGLPVLLGGIAVLVAGGLIGVQVVSVAGLVAYLAGVVWWGRALLVPLRAHGVREFAPASVLAALVWACAGLLWAGWLLATGDGWPAFTDQALNLAAVFAVGFAAQLLSGALSYLIPSVMGGGPSVVRAGQKWFNALAGWRLITINAGLALWFLPAPSWVRVTVSILVVAALGMFIPILIGGARSSAKARRAVLAARMSGEPLPDTTAPGKPAKDRRRAAEPVTAWSSNQVIAGIVSLVLAISLGIGVDPAAAGLPTNAAPATAEDVRPTGNTTTVEVSANGMAFTPNTITVPRGDRLVVVLRNDDPTTAHDLVIGTARTERLQPGETAELDAGVIAGSTQGWCTVAGHRQMGMTLDVVVEGEPAADPAGHDRHTSGGPIPPVADAELGSHIDPVLPPLSDEKVRRYTFTVTEVPLEVAPGLWQTRWTFNGGSVGPVLHGRVGDVFEITLINDGTIGHSIDFHAGALAPDQPMRTIAPGESLVYRFTAERAGVWMYHCSTVPMSSHIAAGMHGGVIIEPDGLPEVDRSYVLVQSEIYLGNAAHGPDDATEVDAAKIVDERPDRVVFNGIANQYDQFPFEARVGERVRFWVLAAGPNRAWSFHIVGGQFDTAWTEGGYTLRRGESAFGGTDGGAQVLPLLPAQGGFVELTFPEAGHYPVVNHVMVDAERGAHGVVRVTE